MSLDYLIAHLPPAKQARLRRKMKKATDSLLAAIADCYGPDSPLLDLYREKTEVELMAEKIINGETEFPDVEITEELKEIFGLE